MASATRGDIVVVTLRVLIWNLALLFVAILVSDIQQTVWWNHGLLYWSLLIAGCLVGSLSIWMLDRRKHIEHS